MTINALDYLADKYNLNLDGKMPAIIASESKRFGRWYALPEIFSTLGLLIGAEIGVEKGYYSERLFEKIPGLKLFSIDPWETYKGYRENISQRRMDSLYKQAQDRLAPFNSTIIRKFSGDAINDFEDESLDFVYIDGNHEFQYVANDIAWWEKKVRVGGIVSGHDYRRHNPFKSYKCHVKDVVQAYAYSHGIRPWFVVMGDKSPSWFWVRV